MADTLPGPTGTPAAPMKPPRPTWPTTALGWWGIGTAIFAVAMFMVILPTITSLFAETIPFTNSGGMPAIGTAVAWIALVINVVAVWLRKERSSMNLVALILLGLFTAFVTMMVVGEGIAGV